MRHAFLCLPLLASLALTGLSSVSLAQSREVVKFAASNDNASLSASVTGQEYRDYILGAQAGQTMSVSLIGDAYFNILPPGSTGEAIYNGSIDGADAVIPLTASGDYTVRVYMMGNDADTGVTQAFTLSFGIM